ncbi:MAG: DUF6350 family protein [Corynebacterium sp.]|uniref:cell division protein PerM n=1 Tax=Corynebacterium sp. TaxID=1720 RepID=UPI0026DFFD33|nr:DUF6350 family protein [Corynebacterium sp.]MDO5669661.1 DUF6350 family protein [Corynebacterium sp.]
MSKKTSPQSRPVRRPRKIRTGGTSAGDAAVRHGSTRATDPTPLTGVKGRLRRYLPVAAIPHGVVVLAIIAVALAGLLVTRTTLAALPATIAQMWLILNLSPVVADGTVLGVLPLLPAMGLVALIARRVRVAVRERVSIADLLVLAAGVIGIPLLLTLIAAAMMWDAGRVFDVGPPPLGHAIARTLILHALALGIGMGGRLWRALLRRYNAPEWLIDAASIAARILMYLSAGALVILVALAAIGWQRQVEVASLYNSGLGVLAVALISLLYIPNAVIAAVGVLFGSEFHIGAASISLYAIDLTALPPLPLLAIIPGWAHQWSILLLLITSMAVAYALGGVRFSIVQTLVTAAFVALFTLLAGYLISGRLGEIGGVGPMHWLTAGLAFAWTAGIGVAAALIGKLAERREAKEEPEAEPEEAPEPEPEVEEEPEEIVDGEVVEEDPEPEPESDEEPAVDEEPPAPTESGEPGEEVDEKGEEEAPRD